MCKRDFRETADQITDYGCNCPTCPIFDKYELEDGWFCTYKKDPQ